MAARTPVTARGIALLALVAAAPGGVLMLTQEEGKDGVAAGDLAVDSTKVEGKTAAVSLTDAGKAKLDAAPAAAPSAAKPSKSFELDVDVPLPTGTRTRVARGSSYPFAQMEVNQSFHVPVGPNETNEKVMSRLSASIGVERAKHAVEIEGETEDFVTRTYQKDADGNFVKDADGKRVVATETPGVRPKTKATVDFKAAVVGDSDPKGPGIRVWRIA